MKYATYFEGDYHYCMKIVMQETITLSYDKVIRDWQKILKLHPDAIVVELKNEGRYGVAF